MEIIKLISDVFTILVNIVPGLIFISIFKWSNDEYKYDFSMRIIWSIAVSFIIKSCFVIAHRFILTNYIFDKYGQFIIMCVAAIMIGSAFSVIVKCGKFQHLLIAIFGKTTNKNYWNDVLHNGTYVKAVLKNGRYIEGSIKYWDESENGRWICLTIFEIGKSEDKIEMRGEDSLKVGWKSNITINLNDIDYLISMDKVKDKKKSAIHKDDKNE